MNAIIVFILRLLLILLSYAFLGWILYSILGDLKKGSLRKSADSIPPITLKAVIGDEKLTKRFRQSEIIIGRDPSVDFSIGNETISLRHCKIRYHQKQWWVEDLKSTNGTYLNNDPVTIETILANADQLRLGKIDITIYINQNVELE